MKINVLDRSTSPLVYDYDFDWEDEKGAMHLGFVCSHDRAIVEPPCCNGADCACGGVRSVYCPDCPEGQGLSDRDVETILTRSESYEA